MNIEMNLDLEHPFADSFFSDVQPQNLDDCFAAHPPLPASQTHLSSYVANNGLEQFADIGKFITPEVPQPISTNDKFAKAVQDLLDPTIMVEMNDQVRDKQMNLLAQFGATLTAVQSTAFLLSPPQTPRGRADSFESSSRLVPSSPAASLGYHSDGESYPASPENGATQEAPLEILDSICGQQQQQADFSQDYELQDLLDTISEEMIADTAALPVINSQESFSSQALINNDLALEQARQIQQQAQEAHERSLLQMAFDSMTSAPSSQEWASQDSVHFQPVTPVTPAFTLDDIDELLSNASASPVHSSFSDHTLLSPAHSMSSDYQDADYVPAAPKKSTRGRKRKSIDSDYGTEKDEAKKLKNAAAAARYREKQKMQSATFETQLAKVAEKHAELAKKFNSRLTERNFMLKLVYEAHKNNQNGLGARKFPAWVDAWFKEQQKD
jgi:hypothetical protein